ncbi:hypothetical protein NPIL_245841 [Nephila pilipes]|uniref:Uncharacterized protein n=1 Tax=Nephila pilipes TaxID=299642 RepID=A0A8X6IFJ8_NEPPI|nr:hypothetical protein NPIL_245841 [Nephila pilipes]
MLLTSPLSIDAAYLLGSRSKSCLIARHLLCISCYGTLCHTEWKWVCVRLSRTSLQIIDSRESFHISAEVFFLSLELKYWIAEHPFFIDYGIRISVNECWPLQPSGHGRHCFLRGFQP